ncbi:hypothetical protein FKM82_020174 [Ascaphus truei]
MQALEDLDYLAALDDDGNLSEYGIIMSEFPLDPQLSKSILAACEFDCVDEMLTLAAMVTAPTVLWIHWSREADTTIGQSFCTQMAITLLLYKYTRNTKHKEKP